MNFFEKFKIDQRKFFQRDLSNLVDPKQIRPYILESELKDFQNLSSNRKFFIEQLDTIQKNILSRYQLEGRNSFNMKLLNQYEQTLLDLKQLQEIVDEQQIFYEKRKDEIIKELENWE